MNIGLAIDKKNGVESKVIGKAYKGSSPLAGNHKGTWADGQNDGEYEIKQATNEWQGWGSCLKPAFEPIIVARKPFKGSLVDNVLKWGVGGLNIDECRVGNEERKNPQAGFIRRGRTDEEIFLGTDKNRPKGNLTVKGRFPANLILTYNQLTFDDVCGGFPNSKSHQNFVIQENRMRFDVGNNGKGGNVNLDNTYQDSGSASRYFYCAKASKKDRDEGLEGFEEKKTGELQGGRKEGSAGSIMLNADGTTRVNPYAGTGTPKKNIHPTVKPTELMQYLIRLVTPNGGVILDPFMGSGSTGKAVVYENRERNKNYDFIGIEKEEEYYNIAKARIENI